MNKFTHKKLLMIPLASLLMVSYTNSVLANSTLEAGEARCKENLEHSGGCRVEFLSPDVNNPYNHVQQFNQAVGRWVNYKEDIHEGADISIEAGNLYRVSACLTKDDECKMTKVFWAPVLTNDPETIPSHYSISGSDGRTVLAGISKESTLTGQLRQLNVYMVTDLVMRFQGRGMGKMLKPKDHDHHGLSPANFDQSHDAHYIHYDVYHNYTGLLKSYKEV